MGKTTKKKKTKKHGGVTWVYEPANTGQGSRTMLWTAQAKVGMENGRTVVKRIRAASVEEGLYELTRLRKEFTEGQEQKQKDALRPTLGQAFDRYLEFTHPHVRPNTYRKYDQVRRLHLQGLMDERLHTITREQLQTAINEELQAGVKNSSAKYYVTVFNQVRTHFELAGIRGIRYTFGAASDVHGEQDSFDTSDCTDLPHPDEILRKASEFEDGRLYNFCVFGLMSLRIGEICGLKYGDIILRDNGRHYVRLERQRKNGIKSGETWGLKSSTSYRTLLIDEGFYKSLNVSEHEPNEFVFPKSSKNYDQDFRRFKEFCGITRTFTPHTLRHVFASHNTARNRNETLIRMCGGWSIGSDVMHRHYVERDSKACDDLLLAYYRDIFGGTVSDDLTADEKPAYNLTADEKPADVVRVCGITVTHGGKNEVTPTAKLHEA